MRKGGTIQVVLQLTYWFGETSASMISEPRGLVLVNLLAAVDKLANSGSSSGPFELNRTYCH
jgi:hypothetical protein